MAEYTELTLRRDSTLNWYASNPRLALGEPGIDMTLHRFKVGNGIDRWNELPYMNDDLYQQADKTTQEIADKVQMLLNKIAANKLDADTKIESLSSDFRTTRREVQNRMDAVEEEQAAYEENLTGEFEAARADLDAGLEEFMITRDNLTVRMDVISGQATEDTEILDARVDANYETHPNLGHNIRSLHAELIAAEHDASEVKAGFESDIAGLRNADAAHDADLHEQRKADDFLQEQVDDTAEGLLRTEVELSREITRGREQRDLLLAEKQARENDILQLSHDIETEREERTAETSQLMDWAEREADLREQSDTSISRESTRNAGHLQEQVDDLAGLAIAGKLEDEAERTAREQADAAINKNSLLRDEHLQEQVDELAGEAITSSLQHMEDKKALREEISAVDEVHSQQEERLGDNLSSVDEHNQEQLDELSGTVIAEILRRKEGLEQEAAIRAESLAHEQDSRKSKDEHLQEQADETAEAVLNLAVKSESDKKELTATLEREAVARTNEDSNLKEQADDLAGAVLDTLSLIKDKEHARQEEADRQSRRVSDIEEREAEADADLSAGILELSVLQSETIRRNKEHFSRVEEIAGLNIEHLQEQADDNAEAALSLTLALSRVGENVKHPTDWSTKESLEIPEPRCAIVNFTGLTSMPTSKTVDIPAVLEFWDLQGNYFKKNILCSAQGAYSMNYVKKNVKVDLLNDDGSEFNLKIGDWVTQDGFHIKAYYPDFFRGIAVVSYDFWDEIMRFNGPLDDRPYKKAQIDRSTIGTASNANNSFGDIPLQVDTGALCHPDGFPCIVYLNGEFYGVFSWQLKKHRNNYRMDKSTAEHIHIDGNIRQVINGQAINWTTFELRNPSKLYTMNGKKYDGDAPLELIDETSEKFDASNKDHVRSATVKHYLEDFVRRFMEFKASPSRERFEELFDWETFRDYTIFIDITHNWDGITNNVQWTTYDGVKWFVNAYDLDLTFSRAPLTQHLNTDTTLPFGYVPLLYQKELETRYKALRDAGIISVEGIASKLEDWVKRVGPDNYELEYKRWPQSAHNDSIYRVRKWLEVNIANMDSLYNYKPESYLLATETTNLSTRLDDETAARKVDTLSLTEKYIRVLYDNGLQEQIDDIMNLLFADFFRYREAQEKQNARFSVIEQALIEAGYLSEEDIPPVTDTEVDTMIDEIFSGTAVPDSDPPSSDDDAEFEADLDEIFGI